MTDLTGLPALDLAIGLSFIFLVLSLLASAVQEGIASLLALRAKTLLRGLGKMLEGDGSRRRPEESANDLVSRLYRHGLIRSLFKTGRGPLKSLATGRERLPSYIAPRTFALALLDIIAPTARDQPDADLVAQATTELNKQDTPIPAETRQALLALLRAARGDVDAFRQNVEAWFDDSMARVSGWYKRQSQLILLAVAVVVTLALNANTLTMADRLWKDPAVRTAVVEEAGKVTAPAADQTENESAAEAKERVEAAFERVDEVQKLGVPMGWTSDPDDPRFVQGTNDLWRFLHRDVAGWLLTIVAISLGAPFWFDTLSRLSRLRSTGKPEQPLPASAFGKANERVVTGARR